MNRNLSPKHLNINDIQNRKTNKLSKDNLKEKGNNQKVSITLILEYE